MAIILRNNGTPSALGHSKIQGPRTFLIVPHTALEGKLLLPTRAFFFPFRVHLSSKWDCCVQNKREVTKKHLYNTCTMHLH